MAIVRWEPFRGLVSLRQAMDQLMEESFVRPSRAMGLMGRELQPLVDMYQTPNEVVVKASLPGVKTEDVEINITGDTLMLKGETKGEEEVKEEDYLYRERYHTSFTRSVVLPGALKADKAEATSDNGILTITIPKAEESEPKTIEVKAKKMLNAEKKEK